MWKYPKSDAGDKNKSYHSLERIKGRKLFSKKERKLRNEMLVITNI